MFGVNEAKILFEKYKDRPILVYGDPDADGLFAMLLVCQYLEMKGLTYSYYVNENRQHGFFLNPEKVKGYLVIAVDFDLIEELDDVINSGAVVICFDHHDICEEPVIRYKDDELVAVVVNNQYPFEPADNRYLSGAGVTYESLCTITPEFKSKEREALVGITLLSDICPIENEKARRYLKTNAGLRDLHRVPLPHLEHGDVELLADGFELLDRRGTVNVAGDEQRALALLAHEPRELRAVGGLARALQADQHNDAGAFRADVELCALAAHERNKLVVDDLDDHLRRGEAFEHLLPDGALADALDEILDDLVADVGLQKGKPDLPHGLLDVRFGEAALAAELLEGRGKLFRQGFKRHIPRASSF